jgi:protein associated with RNAse G/E
MHTTQQESRHVVLRYEKADGTFHRSFERIVLAEDELGTWCGGRPGDVDTWRTGIATPSRSFAVTLIPRDRWWAITWWSRVGHRMRPNVYADVCTPAAWLDDTATMVDLDLDVVSRRDGRPGFEIVDQDEFAVHRVRYGYHPDVVAHAESAADELLEDLWCGTLAEVGELRFGDWVRAGGSDVGAEQVIGVVE